MSRRLQCFAGMSAYASFECSHLQSAAVIRSSAGKVDLPEEMFDQLVKDGRVKEDLKATCMQMKRNAEQSGHVFVAGWVQAGTSFISIWTGEKHNYIKLGRMIVTFKPVPFNLSCWCSHSYRVGCIHKTICKWYLMTTDPGVFTSSLVSATNAAPR